MSGGAELGLAGRVALVTGGTRGLGLAIARKLCGAGCHVYVNYAHSDSDAERAVAELAGLKGTVTALKFDVGDPEAPGRLLRLARARRRHLDILVHNAASYHPMSALRPDIGELWDDVRVAVSPLVQAASGLAELLTRGTGRVVAVSSSGARSVVPGYVSQGIGKAALESLVRYLAVELAPRGVTVNAVSTGKVDKGPDTRDDRTARLLAERTPGGRLTVPEDVANAVALLCTDEAAWIQGQVLTVDGGLGLRA
ncbi:SDR family oxidoreductase [Saccharothrix australiensis]|uniref:Enoyl-[acyl-carrier-protein] reductase [NADH] n=1 Tax=Saccharothrix australiensis TaxID=2072 RepID=A0A495W3I3_9PSEU|nr:SDR family oxidoreductase [Saccharothrix australiensis]RKT55607.1 enoyl-[acyl-carrier-protein] reductase [NADH] [Saccharothrix australiensis]